MSRRIFVLDDELPVLEGVQHIVEKSFPDGEICGVSQSGISALQIIDADPPDILLVDIHLPGISGLEVVNHIRRRHPDVLCVIISAYEQFSIAREALDYGVFAYIVKPVTKSRLLSVLQSACASLEREGQLQSASLAGKAMQRAVEGLLEQQLIPNLFSGWWRPPSVNWEQWLAALRGIRPDFFPVVVPVLIQCGSEQCEEKIAAAVRYKLPCWTGVVKAGQVGVLTGSRDAIAARITEAARDAVRMAGGNFMAEAATPIVTVGDEVPLERVWQVIPDILPSNQDGLNLSQLRSSLQELWKQIRSGDKSAIDHWCGQCRPMFEQLMTQNHDQLHMLLQQANAVRDVETPVPRTLHDALEYLRRNFHNPVTLEDTAAVAGVTAAHLSRLFRKELQLSFSDYLTSLRMERARSLLEEAERSVREVGCMVGYQDPNYFSRVFKRWVGVSPSEFGRRVDGGYNG